MKNYINVDNLIHSYRDDISQELLDAKIEELGLTPISDTELEILLAETDADIIEQSNKDIYTQIDTLEKSLLRPLREYALDNANQTALTKITQVEDDIVILRNGLQ